MFQVKRSARKVLPFIFLAAVLAGVIIHMSLIFVSGVNLFLTSKLGFALAAWSVSPALTLLSVVLLFGGVIGIMLSRK